MANNLKLSKKHGVNPSLQVCTICGHDDGIAMFGYITGDKEAPRRTLSPEPCKKCKADIENYKKQGFVIFVINDEFENEEMAHTTPWQHFKYLTVVKREAEFIQDWDTSKGACFLQASRATKMGLDQFVES